MMFGLMMWPVYLNAETVQRWQDSAGQWHFGDHAAAKGHASKPVLVTTPISIVKNDQPAELKLSHATTTSTKKSQKKLSAKSAVTLQPNHCDVLRQQMDDRTAKRRKNHNLQALTSRYEHECVAGQYYGN